MKGYLKREGKRRRNGKRQTYSPREDSKGLPKGKRASQDGCVRSKHFLSAKKSEEEASAGKKETILN